MKKIEITSTKDEVIEIIRMKIISGQLTKEDTITQNYIADKFGLSRMPIREAFNALVQEGLLERTNSRKLKVVELSKKTIDSYCRILTSVEMDLISNISNSDINKSSEIFNTLKERLLQLNPQEQIIEFHRFISEYQNDLYIKRLHKNIFDGLFRHSILHCIIDYQPAVSAIHEFIDIISKGNFDPSIARDVLLISNRSIVNAILKDRDI